NVINNPHPAWTKQPAEAHQKGKIKEGDLVVLAAFGSGFTWGSALIRW
ncbi:hypothetical protein OAT27_01365, partial [Flavobacteriaceae bacterium]|nr:hypothetical protein [Flavobacteriaceae bacterium]